MRKDRAMAETTASLVLSKKVAAIFNKGKDERSASKIAKCWPKILTLRMAQACGCAKHARLLGRALQPCAWRASFPCWPMKVCTLASESSFA